MASEIERNNQYVQILRVYELRLLRCTLSPPSHTNSQPEPIDSLHLHLHLHHILFCLETGDYVGALSSDAARIVLGSSSTFHSIESAEGFYSELIGRVESFMLNEPEDEYASACRVILVMCVAVAALFAFTQCNMTGPQDDLSRCPLPLENVDHIEIVEWENWARNQLISAGSDLIGKFSNCQYLVLAKELLMRMRDFLFEGSLSSTYGIRSISWWLARLLLIQQRILDERSSSLFDLLQVTMGETLHHFDTFKKVHGYWGTELHDGEASVIASVVHLEAGINNYFYGRVDPCRKHFESAEEAAGIQLSVTGALGFRTVHQVDPKAQRVLITKRVPLNGAGTSPAVTTGIQTHDCTDDKNNSHLLQNETDETCDIYMTPKLLEKGSESEINIQGIQNAGHTAAPLTEIQQAVILAHCLLIEKSSRQDELQRWDMAPYIEAIDSQQSSYFTLRSFCDILRIRWELTRSRTKWRALELMEKLVKGVQGPSPGVAERIPFIYSVYLPVVPALQKEYGETLVGCGLIGEAITVFEGLELWDNLIYCNCLLGKKSAAVELIKTRLSEMPNDPRLWCSLGDVTNNDACYEKALEVSKNRSARAMRSLARSAYDRGDYEKSKLLWESAMALNSLYPDGWFALGAASLKARDVEKALDAFTRAVQLDPENGEAWNNIACLHMIKKRNKEAFIAFKEALKFKRDSWQLWENYSHVAMDVGNIGQALEGVQRILNMTGNKRIDTELLEKITLEMEKRSVNRHYVSSAPTNDLNGCSQGSLADPHVDSGNESVNVEFAVGSSRETENLLEFLGKVLQQIVKNTSTADIWGLYARWYKTRGDLTMYSEALLKQVRSYQGSDLWNDGGRFKRYARASLELCKAYMEISSSTGSPRELSTAQMHLKNIIKQADNFSNTQEFRDIKACLEEVKMKLQSG